MPRTHSPGPPRTLTSTQRTARSHLSMQTSLIRSPRSSCWKRARQSASLQGISCRSLPQTRRCSSQMHSPGSSSFLCWGHRSPGNSHCRMCSPQTRHTGLQGRARTNPSHPGQHRFPWSKACTRKLKLTLKWMCQPGTPGILCCRWSWRNTQPHTKCRWMPHPCWHTSLGGRKCMPCWMQCRLHTSLPGSPCSWIVLG